MSETRWDRPRIGIVVYLDLAACIVGMLLCRLIGGHLLMVGMKLRGWMPPERGHAAFLLTLRIREWQPRMGKREWTELMGVLGR